MKESKYYICDYCFDEFVPKRRRVQRYCSNSCRSKAYHARKSMISVTESTLPLKHSVDTVSKSSENMSLAGVGNAAAGTFIANTVINALKGEDKKAATKGDIKILAEQLMGRYHKVNNLPLNTFGHYPYYDIVNGEIVYLQNEF